MRNLPLILLACVVFMFSLNTVWAQSIPISGNNLSGTITTTNTFQSIQGATNNRNGCTVQNKASFTSGDLQYVYFDSTNSANCSAATIAGSSVLLPGQAASCTVAANLILKDQVCITGTSGDPFFADFQ